MKLVVKNLIHFSNRVFRNITKNTFCSEHTSKLYALNQSDGNGGAKIENGIDIEALFLDKRVQDILKKVTGLDLNKVYRTRHKPLSTPKYQFLTDEQLEKLRKESEDLALGKLQMPPVMREREPLTGIISDDPELQGYDDCQYVFTDITYGVSDRKRLIVTRHPDGKLRYASWDQRHRMNCIYFPMPGRDFDIPRMFQEDYIEQLLDKKEYKFILDRACIQFDPDDPLYIKTTRKTYEHINESKKFEDLHSTRHFGPMVFHLAITKNIDNLLLYMIQKVQIEDAVNVIRLYYFIHPSSKVTSSDDSISYIQSYIDADAKKKSMLQLAFQTYIELYQNTLEDKRVTV